jgi:hypothetical protein
MRWLVAILLVLNVGLYLWLTGPGKKVADPGVVELSAINPQSMRLLTDADRVADVPASGVVSICVRIGPFVAPGAAAQARELLDEFRLSYATDTIKAREVRAFRVYVGPYEASDLAEIMRERLRDREIEHYMMTEADGTRMFSLGLFSREVRAERYVETVAVEGIEANLREEFRKLAASEWLEIRDLAVDSDARRRLEVADWNEAHAKLRRIPCN